MSEQPHVVAQDEQSVIVVNAEQPAIVVAEQPVIVAADQPVIVASAEHPVKSNDEPLGIASGEEPVRAPQPSLTPRQIRRENIDALAPYQQTEVLIQYGHLEEDLQQLAMATHRQKERAQEFGLAMMFGMAAPFAAVESLYAAFRIVAPFLMVDVAFVSFLSNSR